MLLNDHHNISSRKLLSSSNSTNYNQRQITCASSEGKQMEINNCILDCLLMISFTSAPKKQLKWFLVFLTNIDFMGEVSHFLCTKFQWTKHEDRNVYVCLSQEAYPDYLIKVIGLTQSTIVAIS